MPVTTTSAAIHIAPVVVKTFLKHGKKKADRFAKSETREDVPQDDIFFDEAFHIVKAFIDMGTKNTVESLQAFTNTHVPAPYWAAVSPVTIPLSTCNAAADSLIEWFGPEEIKLVVGGERWWQVRGLDGIDAEWVAEMEDLGPETEIKAVDGKKLSNAEANIKRMEHLETVMLYVHGGGYFWGSINTHRYQILHYAHKMRGRAFAVNYRKAPQYPWPCALQDVIAAYIYLIRPPPGAIHKAVSPSKIVFAGDSAGGGLCITVLTVLRDLGLPMPAGAVLISPWVDLTHSFPSVMQNIMTDIIPEHGFLAKPSTLWPVPTQPEKGGRIVPTESNLPPKPGNADTLKPSLSRISKEKEAEHDTSTTEEKIKAQEEMLKEDDTESFISEKVISGSDRPGKIEEELENHGLDHWEPNPPKIMMEDPNAHPLELRSQIQMYATTEQLIHPLVSPILQSSLGDLPPLYIIAGDGEVLRDEVIYLAHKAAHPSDYPTRQRVLRDSARQRENAKKFTTPTKVHLQVFDGMCHVLTVFMFTESARYAYRSIAEFAKHVTQNESVCILRNPFPELPRSKGKGSHDPRHKDEHDKSKTNGHQLLAKSSLDIQPTHSPASRIDMKLYLKTEQTALLAADQTPADSTSSSSSMNQASEKDHPSSTDGHIPQTFMIRERVDIYGTVRPMEPANTLPALKVDSAQVGILKEAPAQRWRAGQDIWDKAYAKRAKKVIKQQSANQAKAERLLENAIDQGFIHRSHDSLEKVEERKSYRDKIQVDRRWGPLDLEDENPPATAIAGRRDTLEAVALLKNSIYHAAPVTHLTVPKLKTRDAVRAAFDPNDNPNKNPKQSSAEEQVSSSVVSIHGLRIWDDLLRYFGRKTAAKAIRGISTVSDKVGL
ncbi:hypothetical protein HYPSUDRAFT_31857 [Hypholoma sublateritium FD-334 SS-4]|uniref:Alpha/beta hydrolase fold-3 domain-containing protein n=1 Tax=Hypholoma sublateritium (strain FD-334 SS-4) TaxID=945553 RepID=A0A0D2PGB1_HYPSF|nr:hypothetical protein HYPSUDRAFT_31857 [Hypholoma sublateritium FD-334 SS-4]